MNENIFISLMDYFSVAQFLSVNSAEEKKNKLCVCLCVVWFLNFIIAAVQIFIISSYKIRNSPKHREAENSSISLAFVPGFKQSKLRMHVVFTQNSLASSNPFQIYPFFAIFFG